MPSLPSERYLSPAERARLTFSGERVATAEKQSRHDAASALVATRLAAAIVKNSFVMRNARATPDGKTCKPVAIGAGFGARH
jgi:hypothetical protein